MRPGDIRHLSIVVSFILVLYFIVPGTGHTAAFVDTVTLVPGSTAETCVNTLRAACDYCGSFNEEYMLTDAGRVALTSTWSGCYSTLGDCCQGWGPSQYKYCTSTMIAYAYVTLNIRTYVSPHCTKTGYNIRIMTIDGGDSSQYTTTTVYQPDANVIPEKNAGRCTGTCDTLVGNPVNAATGNKYEEVLDVSLSVPGIPIEFKRSYNSTLPNDGPLGYGWTHNYNIYITSISASPLRVRVNDADGRGLYFVKIPQTYTGETRFYGESGVRDRLKKVTSTGQYILRRSGTDLTYTFDATTLKVSSITDSKGNSLTFTYNTSGYLTRVEDNYGNYLAFAYSGSKIASVADPKSQAVTYTYSGSTLTQATYPDSRNLKYAYTSYTYRMTDKKDTDSNVIGHWAYDSYGRVSSYYRFLKDSVQQEKVDLTYNSTTEPTLTTLTRSTGTTSYTTAIKDGLRVVTAVDGCGATCGGSRHKSFAYNGNTALTDVTRTSESIAYTNHYTYDSPAQLWDLVGEVTSVTEAYGRTEARTTNYSYTHRTDDPFLLTNKTESRASVVSTGQSSTVTTAYDTQGNVSSVTVSGYALVSGTPTLRTYTTSYQYNTAGQLTQIDGPRTDVSDVTTLAYYANSSSEGNNRGRLHTVTNALGHVTTLSDYDANGNIGTITAPDGVVTVRTYDERNRLKTSTNQTTTGQIQYFYDARGNLSYVIPPEGNRIDYTYNLADKLTEIRDNQGNKIKYTYDVEGNRTREEIVDPNSVLKKYLDMTYDAYNNIYRITNPDSTYTEYTYNERSDRTQVRDSRANTTAFTYDAFDRITSMTRPGSNVTGYTYDTRDNPASVTNPNSNATQYTYDDFGRLNRVVSPDTGTTAYVHDPAGNVSQMTDARGTTVNYTYDATNRVTAASFPDSSQSISFTYDSTGVTYGTGRLTGRIDPSGTYTFHYNAQGDMIREVKTVNGISYTTQYGYSKNGVLTSITYPSGRVVSYTMNTAGRISQVSMTTSGTPVNLASSITYMPFGDVASLTYGNSLALSKTYTNQYRVSAITAGSVLSLSYAYDANGNITSMTDSLGTTPSQYLTSSTYSYQTGSNVLTSITGTPTATFTHDANGNITAEGTRTFVYDLSNRLVTVTDGETQTASYVYDARNLRTKKTTSAGSVIYHYDINGHLIAETDTSGNTLTEYVYLDDMPLAMVKPTDVVYYYHNDHINTPRVMTDSTGTVVWKAMYNAFGHADIDASSTITNNLRFPGQYYDAETGLHYNWNRYYDPRTGRYLTPDPVGLEGGIDPYVYVDNQPVHKVDPEGLAGKLGGYPNLNPPRRTPTPSPFEKSPKASDNRCGSCSPEKKEQIYKTCYWDQQLRKLIGVHAGALYAVAGAPPIAGIPAVLVSMGTTLYAWDYCRKAAERCSYSPE